MNAFLAPVSLRRLQVFLAVCETLHMARAAELLGVAQPALSQQIKALEEGLGVRLFHRQKRSLELTAAGQICQTHAKALLLQHASLIDIVQQAARGEQGQIRLGYVASALFEEIFPAQLKAMQDRFPGITLTLHESHMEALLGGLVSGDLDIALLRAPVHVTPPLVHRVHSTQSLLVIVPAGHPLARLEEIPIQRLAGEPMISLPDADNIGIMRTFSRIAAEAGMALNVKWQVANVSSVLGLVAAGLGYGIVPAQLVDLSSSRVAARPLAGRSLSSELWLVWHAQRETLVLRKFLEVTAGV